MRPPKSVILFSTNEVTISLTRFLIQTRCEAKVYAATSVEIAAGIFSRIEADIREVEAVLIDGSCSEIAYRMKIDNQIPVVVFGNISAAAEYMADYIVPSGPPQFQRRLLEAVKMACQRKRGPKTSPAPVKNIPIVARAAA